MKNVATTMDLKNALRARDRAAINQVASGLLDQRTPLGAQWFSVAHVLVRNGEVSLALLASQRAVEENAGSAKARFELARILASVDRQDESLALMEAIAPAELNPIEHDHFLGTCALELGDFDVAKSAFDRAVATWPGSAPSWLSLAALPPGDDSALLIRLNDVSSAIAAASPDYQAQWHYAKGAVLDRLRRTDEAFLEFAAGADLVRPTRAYDSEADWREVELAAEFTSAAVSHMAQHVQTDSSRPVLVVGLPRSGTTLVEQILTSHSKIAGGGEMPFGSILTREIGGYAVAQLESFVSAHGADHLTQLYLHLGDEQFGNGQRFVDKCLGNSRALGVLASVLPNAPIIWVRRNPLDCAWSCFHTYFSEGIEWSWSLADIAAHFRAEDRLHAHWHDVLGGRMLTLSYEELVAEPNIQTGRILAHANLKPEPAIEAAQRTRRPVSTASVAQVRQPMYQTSVGAADRYRTQLEPFIKAYED